MFGSDGREHAEYDLVLTNAFTGAATLSALSVRADGKPALTLAGDGLVAATHTLLASDATATSTAFTQVDVRAGRTAPKRITNRVAYAIPADAPVRSIIGSTVSASPVLRTDPRPPVGLLGAADRHRLGQRQRMLQRPDPRPARETLITASDGDWVTPELFAVDWIAVGGRFYDGDGTQNAELLGSASPCPPPSPTRHGRAGRRRHGRHPADDEEP